MEVFTRPCPEWLSPLKSFTEELGASLNLPTLSLHIHQVLGAVVFYQLVYLVISPVLSRLLLPTFYPNFPRRTQINWDVHVVSFVQSVFVCWLALWGMWTDSERRLAGSQRTTEGALYRVFGYTMTGGAMQGYAAGYFLWDLVISVYHIDIMGVGFVAHAVSALVVFSLGFRPFVNYYAPIFILFELSSPFLNIHWFCDKLRLTGSKIQLINGFFLLGSFFGCRLIYGTYNSILVFKDIFHIYANPPLDTHPSPNDLISGGDILASEEKLVLHPYAGKSVPLWLAAVYLGSNVCLNCLNYYWFSKMIRAVSARFNSTPPPPPPPHSPLLPKVTVGETGLEEMVVVGEIAGEEDEGVVKVEGMDLNVVGVDMKKRR